MTTVALDVDFQKIYAVASDGRVIAKASNDRDDVVNKILASRDVDTVLMEIASPVMYIRDIKVVYNVVKWALWNMAMAQLLDRRCHDHDVMFLVAPSHVWTRGHALDVRHGVAKCTQRQKDLRECEAMLYYYQQDPSKWVTLTAYLENL